MKVSQAEKQLEVLPGCCCIENQIMLIQALFCSATAGLLSAGSAPSLQTPSHSRQSSQGSGRLPSSHSRQPSQTSTISLPSRPHSDFHATPTCK